MNSFNLDLGPVGAPGFELIERLDFSGHPKRENFVVPHINVDVYNFQDQKVVTDLTNNQLPGFNTFDRW